MPKCRVSHKTTHAKAHEIIRTLLLSAGITVSLPSLAQEPAASPKFDWYPLESLTAEQKARLSPGCEGLYLDPMQSVKEKLGEDSESLDRYPLQIEADSSEIRDGETAVLEGNVTVSQGARRIQADKMHYDMVADEALLEGKVVIRQPGVLLYGSEAKANGVDHSASFKEAEFLLHQQHLRGGAESISQSSDKVIELENGTFTSCEPGTNTWSLEGENITIDTVNQQGSGRNIKLKLKDIPVFYLPYITFPVGDKRKSGFLFPSPGLSERNGLDLAVPYYFNLAPNYDATVTPRIISKRGFAIEAEGRHLSRYFSTQADMAMLFNDRGGRSTDLDKQIEDGIISEEEARPYKGKNRWLGHFSQEGGANERWYSEIEYSRVSDNDYFRDLGTTSFTVQNTTHLLQAAETGYQLDNWRFSGRVQDYQVLLYDVDDPYRRLPQIDITGNYQVGLQSVELKHAYTRFDHADDVWRNGSSIIKGQRLNTDYRINVNQRAPWGFIKPELGVQSLSYLLDEDSISPTAEKSPVLATVLASLDTGLVFEHPDGDFLQTLEPRAYYLYRSHTDHNELLNVTEDGQAVNFDTSERTFSYSQLYRDSRFTGGDRLEDANRLTLGVTSNWYRNQTDEEYLSVSLGQIFYFDDQLVSLDNSVVSQEKSEFAGELRTRLGPYGRFFMSGIYDGETSEFTRGTAGVQLATPSNLNILNLAYSYVRENSSSPGIDQIDLSLVTPVNKQWATMARYNYDYRSKRELETFFGLEYNDCCYLIRLLARRWLDSNITALADSDALYDEGIFIQLHLKGLGSSGAKVDSILEDSIYGYREREESLKK